MSQTDSCKVHLPGGRTVDICTRSGADAFLQVQSADFKFFSSNVGDATKIREKSRRKKNGKLSAGVHGLGIHSGTLDVDNEEYVTERTPFVQEYKSTDGLKRPSTSHSGAHDFPSGKIAL